MMRLFKKMIGSWWVVRECGFPYPDGYATYLPRKKMVLDTGLTKEEAQQVCNHMNGVTG